MSAGCSQVHNILYTAHSVLYLVYLVHNVLYIVINSFILQTIDYGMHRML